MSELTIETAEVFEPLLQDARYKGAYGGRGSGKSHFFGEHLVEECLLNPGLRAVCVREVQKSLEQSAKKLIEGKIEALGLGSHFEVQKSVIKTPGGGEILFQGMQDHTAESIKSLEGIDRAWIEEAQTLSARSLELLRPTIRKAGSQIWASWNPTRKTDAIDKFLRQSAQNRGIVVKANWSDNPWFPQELEMERLDDKLNNPDRYDHIWEGDYQRVYEGAYYSPLLVDAENAGRVCDLDIDPSLTVRTWHDLAGAGDKADAYSMWVGQFVDQQIHMHGHYRTEGQSSKYHINWLRDWCLDRGIRRCVVTLPHDGDQVKQDYSWRNIWNAASEPGVVEFIVEVVPNQGRGAAMKRIEEARKIFPRVWFDKDATEQGREALASYHEKRDEVRNMGLGPNHDWSSHDADSFGLMACVYQPPGAKASRETQKRALYGRSGRAKGYLAA